MRKRELVEHDVRSTDIRCVVEVLLDLRDLLVKQGKARKKKAKVDKRRV